jgi:gamma-glutamyl-gamma-aminobutyrate hydrolase PuuD
MKKVLIVNDRQDMGYPYYPMFRFIGTEITEFQEPESIALVVFTGGSDVNPSLYKENTHPKCYCDIKRDLQEVDIFNKAVECKIPMFGICRGAQFLCVMTGGSLVQHTNGHHQKHFIHTSDKRYFEVSSAHHQMMIPKEDKDILAWSSNRLSKFYFNGNGETINYNREVEAVEFPSIKSYGVQYHPEVMGVNTQGFRYCQELIKRLV